MKPGMRLVDAILSAAAGLTPGPLDPPARPRSPKPSRTAAEKRATDKRRARNKAASKQRKRTKR